MKLLISSHFFAPNVGGIELVSGILATEFAALGHEIRVITQTPATKEPFGQGFTVIRQPSVGAVFALLRWCDVYMQSNISLPTLWPALVVRKPVVVVHHTWIARADGRMAWQDHLKLGATRLVKRNLAVSRALADTIPARCGLIANPYQDDIFWEDPAARRDRDLVFVGRLVSDKGCSILLDALAALAEKKIKPTLTIIGAGPELEALRSKAAAAGMGEQVSFAGQLTGKTLASELNRHRILVAPSLWKEPFGIVALEGIACGCVVVGSSGGGLPDAMGLCGESFPNGNWKALAEVLDGLLASPKRVARLREGASMHLAGHTRTAVAKSYLTELAGMKA